MPIELSGIVFDSARVESVLRRVPTLVSEALGDSAETVRNVIRGRTPVGVRETRGQAKQSWSDVTLTSNGYSFESPLSYINVLEEGLYPGVGPRTVAAEGGIFSRQAPGGILNWLVSDENQITDIIEAVVDEVVRQLNREL